MIIESVRLTYKQPLVNKYLYHFPAVECLFSANPYRLADFQYRLQTVANEYKADREELVRILLSYNKNLGCSQKTVANIEMLRDKNSVVVITGQQAGVFTGPLYTIYKTITVIQLAQKLSRDLGCPVIPFFWVASEDHDFQEINHLDFINRQGRLDRLVLEEEPGGKFSVGHIPVSEAVYKLIDALAESTNPAEWKEGYIEQLKDYACSSENLAEWFARIMTGFFTDYGLVMVHPMLPGIRKLMAPLFEQFVIRSEEVNRALEQGKNMVMDLGFTPQVDKDPEHLHLFRYVDGERLPLLKENDVFTVRGRDLHWREDELLAAIRDNPEDFSPNVVLRPVAQDYVLPLLAYVAGPGEISYYALYKAIYPLFGMNMPIIYPRANITLLEGNISKLMQKYGLSLNDVVEGMEEKQRQFLKELETVDIEGLFNGFREKVGRCFQEVNDEVIVIDPSLRRVGDEAWNKALYQINHYYEKVQQYHRKKNDTLVRQLGKISLSLFPKNNFQERVFNIFPYLFKHGPGLINGLVGLPLIEGTDHKIVHINPEI
ncbi:bacillithiol biosynthesis cysteine-adding enzyme BshC [Thermincola potens]|uniref:Putative cysteine ligase BshC n=1 Tax=Thermincola potens (strain JR) TaxID=635013 RepID=D5XCJ5_THEPJ|nr:bacillithiol biosynthesis cysteine-adding enzyme BshC [Thermincola potens]ADG81621.1 protein of unknown function UCP012535 [Thermincola potens JR]